MAKTAYLFDFSVRTRVIADPNDFRDEGEFYDYLSWKAREKILSNAESYLNGDNGEYVEDEECPYGTFTFDEGEDE